MLRFRSDGDLAAALLGDGEHRGTDRHVLVEVRPARREVLIVRGTAVAFPVFATISWMLDGQEHGFIVRRQQRAAHFGTDGNAEEQLGCGAGIAFGIDCPKPIGAPSIGGIVAVGRNPEPSHGVDGAVIGHAEPAILRRCGREGGSHLRNRGVTTFEQDFPCAAGGGKVTISLGDLDDMAESIFGARISDIDFVGRAARLLVSIT